MDYAEMVSVEIATMEAAISWIEERLSLKHPGEAPGLHAVKAELRRRINMVQRPRPDDPARN